MAWRIELQEKAKREIDGLDPPVARRKLKFLHDRVAKLDNPRTLGAALQGQDKRWRYRVGDYRIVCSLEDDRLVVLAVRVAHRRGVYCQGGSHDQCFSTVGFSEANSSKG